jgi:hypothetical protein
MFLKFYLFGAFASLFCVVPALQMGKPTPRVSSDTPFTPAGSDAPIEHTPVADTVADLTDSSGESSSDTISISFGRRLQKDIDLFKGFRKAQDFREYLRKVEAEGEGYFSSSGLSSSADGDNLEGGDRQIPPPKSSSSANGDDLEGDDELFDFLRVRPHQARDDSNADEPAPKRMRRESPSPKKDDYLDLLKFR